MAERTGTPQKGGKEKRSISERGGMKGPEGREGNHERTKKEVKGEEAK